MILTAGHARLTEGPIHLVELEMSFEKKGGLLVRKGTPKRPMKALLKLVLFVNAAPVDTRMLLLIA